MPIKSVMSTSLEGKFQAHVSENFHARLSKMKELSRTRGGRKTLLVVADFDLTLTAPGSLQCHHMIGRSSILTEESRDTLSSYLKGQTPVGHEPLLKHSEWWDRVHGLLATTGLKKSDIVEMVKTSSESGLLQLRPGAREFMNACNELDIPFLVVSAGISDIIQETLRYHGVLHPNVRISSNSMLFCDESLALRGFALPVVHSRNKHESHVHEREYFEALQKAGRCCALVLGDKPHDATVAINVPLEATLSVGFYDLAECLENNLVLEDYTSVFDITQTDPSMDGVLKMLQEIVGESPS